LTADSLETALATQLANTVTTNAAKAAAASIMDEPRNTSSIGPGGGRAGRLMTAEDKAKIKAAIAKATSAEEIKVLERRLKEGWIPQE